MRVGILNAAVFCDDRRRRLLADAGNSRNVIVSIPHQCLHIDKLCRRHLVFFEDFLRVVVLNLGSRPLRLRDPDLDMICGKLQEIPVTGYDRNLHACRLTALCDGSKQIIRLVTAFFNDGHTHRTQHLFHHWNLLL